MIEHAVRIAHEIKANALLVCIDVINDPELLMDEIKKISVLLSFPGKMKAYRRRCRRMLKYYISLMLI